MCDSKSPLNIVPGAALTIIGCLAVLEHALTVYISDVISIY
jgi:hypothetical protein